MATRKRKKKEVPFSYELWLYSRETKEDEFDSIMLSHGDKESVEIAAQTMGIDIIPKGVFVEDTLEYGQIREIPQVENVYEF